MISLNKSNQVRLAALLLTGLCWITLRNVAEPGSVLWTSFRGLILSLILNASLWSCSFRLVRTRLRYLAALGIFVSGFGVFIISPYGWVLAFLLLAAHIWFAIDLILNKEAK